MLQSTQRLLNRSFSWINWQRQSDAGEDFETWERRGAHWAGSQPHTDIYFTKKGFASLIIAKNSLSVAFGWVSRETQALFLGESENRFVISDHTDSSRTKKDHLPWQRKLSQTLQRQRDISIVWIYFTKSSYKGPFSWKFATRKEIVQRSIKQVIKAGLGSRNRVHL